jgi:hypothetical protein
MTNLVALNNVDHHDLKVALRHGPAFGDGVNQMLLFPTEFEEAQRDFPILFRRDPVEGLQAVAVLGLDRDENLFLDGERWTSRYVPALQQRGPFSIGLVASGMTGAAPEPMIHVDLDDPRTGAGDGVPVFLPQGGNSLYLEQVAHVLRGIYAGIELARPMFAAFEAAGLIEPVQLSIQLDDTRSFTLSDYFWIDAARFEALSGEALEQLHASGFLHLASLVLASRPNINRLIALKNARDG